MLIQSRLAKRPCVPSSVTYWHFRHASTSTILALLMCAVRCSLCHKSNRILSFCRSFNSVAGHPKSRFSNCGVLKAIQPSGRPRLLLGLAESSVLGPLGAGPEPEGRPDGDAKAKSVAGWEEPFFSQSVWISFQALKCLTSCLQNGEKLLACEETLPARHFLLWDVGFISQ